MERLHFAPEDVAAGLRELATAIELGQVPAEQAVVVTGGLGELVMVHALGQNTGTAEAILALTIGQQVLVNTVMPDGNITPT